jgi:hypothetical protein
MGPLNLKKKECDMIRIKPDGSMVFLHEDKITEALINEGELKMERASDVKFNNKTKAWEVFLPGSDTKMVETSFKDRKSALAGEKIILERFL